MPPKTSSTASPANSSPKKNAIVTCCTANWLPYAAITLLTCHQNGGSELADMFVVTLGATQSDVQKFETFLAKNNFNAKLLSVTLPDDARNMHSDHYGPGTFLRLFLPNWISDDYDRVLYLDSDVLARAPIKPIFEIDLENKPLAAVPCWLCMRLTSGQRNGEEHISRLGMASQSQYFNSGIVIFDWKRICREQRLQNCVAIATDFKTRNIPTTLADQDLLNSEFENDWKPLGLSFNQMEQFFDYIKIKPVFRHFNSPIKPWSPDWSTKELRNFNAYYRSVLKDTGWPVPSKINFNRLYTWVAYCSIRRALRFKERALLLAQFPD